MRSYNSLALIGAAILAAAGVVGLAFALDGGESSTDDPTVAARASGSPTSQATVTPSPSMVEPTRTPEASETTAPYDPAATPCSAGCASSGIEGKVVQSPTCPVETDPPKPECAPRPYQATIAAWTADRSAQVLTFTADKNGQFRVALDPGDYEIEPQGEGRFPMPPPPFTVTVAPNQFAHLEIEYDTGIR